MASVAIAYQVVMDRPVNEAHDFVLTHFSPSLSSRWGYKVTADTGTTITMTRKYRPTWAVVVAIVGLFFLLLSLLFLLVKNEDILVFSFAAAGLSDTKINVTGSGPNKVPELLRTLGQPPSAEGAGASH